MKAYVALGANTGSPRKTMTEAVHQLGSLPKTRVVQISPLYKTQAVGGPRQPDYLNAVLKVDTGLSTQALMKGLLRTEQALGRIRREKWGPRVIDLDLLAAGRRRINHPGLTVPHPRYHERRFVLIPFCDIAPRFVHPQFGAQNLSLLRKLTPKGQRVTMVALWNGTQFSPSKKGKKAKPPSSR